MKKGFVLMVIPKTGLFVVGNHLESKDYPGSSYSNGSMVIYSTRDPATKAKTRRLKKLAEQFTHEYRIHIQEVEYREVE